MTTPPAADVVHTLMARDRFSQWLGIEVLEAAVGHSVLRMTIRDDMVNGFGTSHGGILFSLADSAFAQVTCSPPPRSSRARPSVWPSAM